MVLQDTTEFNARVRKENVNAKMQWAEISRLMRSDKHKEDFGTMVMG